MRISANEIKQADLLSGKVVQNKRGTFWFKKAGNNLDPCNEPIKDNLHRIGGPAVILNDGTVHWYKNGKSHREDGPASVFCHGAKFWYKNGKSHREDGPAVEWNGGEMWYKNDRLHRENGPALTYNGRLSEWYINGKFISFEWLFEY